MDCAEADLEDVTKSAEPTLQGATATNAHDENELSIPLICVICLERTTDETTALPCHHDQFHFSCLGTWLQRSRACPLCKKDVKGIKYHDRTQSQLYYLPENRSVQLRPSPSARSRRARVVPDSAPAQVDPVLAFRKRIYEEKLCSLYVGSNKYSGYQNLTHEIIGSEDKLIVKAKKWIRRELAVFDFLRVDSPARADGRASNPEYLLEYIVAIVRAIDIKGSAGQAQELLQDYQGRTMQHFSCTSSNRG